MNIQGKLGTAYKYRVVEQKYYMENAQKKPLESVIGEVCSLTTNFVFK